MLSASPWLFWAHLTLWWVLAHYLVLDHRSLGRSAEGRPAARSWLPVLVWPIALVVGAAALIGLQTSDWRMVALFVMISFALVTARTVNPEWLVWERELLATTAYASASAWMAYGLSLAPKQISLIVPMSTERLGVACLVSALFVFTIHGGTYIVRGILKSSGVPADSTKSPDAIQLRRGLWIGALERVLLFGVVVAGSYEALGFVVAAKGLIRSRDLEANRDLTEYFLIGSLASVGVALATGIAARFVIQSYW